MAHARERSGASRRLDSRLRGNDGMMPNSLSLWRPLHNSSQPVGSRFRGNDVARTWERSGASRRMDSRLRGNDGRLCKDLLWERADARVAAVGSRLRGNDEAHARERSGAQRRLDSRLRGNDEAPTQGRSGAARRLDSRLRGNDGRMFDALSLWERAGARVIRQAAAARRVAPPHAHPGATSFPRKREPTGRWQAPPPLMRTPPRECGACAPRRRASRR